MYNTLDISSVVTYVFSSLCLHTLLARIYAACLHARDVPLQTYTIYTDRASRHNSTGHTPRRPHKLIRNRSNSHAYFSQIHARERHRSGERAHARALSACTLCIACDALSACGVVVWSVFAGAVATAAAAPAAWCLGCLFCQPHVRAAVSPATSGPELPKHPHRDRTVVVVVVVRHNAARLAA